MPLNAIDLAAILEPGRMNLIALVLKRDKSVASDEPARTG